MARLGQAALVLAGGIAGCGAALALESLDSLLEELVEEQVEQQVEQQIESRVLDSIEGALEPVVEPVEQLLEVPAPRNEPYRGELDPQGQSIERGTWIVLVRPEQVDTLSRHGFIVRERRGLDALGRVLVRIEAPVERELAQAALELALEAPDLRVDFNHVYRSTAGTAPAAAAAPAASSAARVRDIAIGLIDSSVAARHPALRRAAIEQRDFVPYGRPRPDDHGTAVASVLVGDSSELQGLLHGAHLRAAAVLFQDEHGESIATAASLVQALDWLAASGVRVINISLAGPPNRVLEGGIEAVTAKDIVVVAAVGNAGPAAPPLYPAAYESVVGITAVDEDGRVYLYANRGPHLDFAANGVGIPVARAAGGYGTESGTSLAAPQVAAAVARALAEPGATPRSVLSGLARSAVDLGEPGFDETFGHGWITAAE